MVCEELRGSAGKPPGASQGWREVWMAVSWAHGTGLDCALCPCTRRHVPLIPAPRGESYCHPQFMGEETLAKSVT